MKLWKESLFPSIFIYIFLTKYFLISKFFSILFVFLYTKYSISKTTKLHSKGQKKIKIKKRKKSYIHKKIIFII